MIGLVDQYFCRALADAARNVPGVEYVAVAHLGTEDEYLRQIAGFTKEEYAERYGVRLYEDPEEMLRAERLQGVLITTEHARSPEAVEVAARHGVHAFVAKPMATTLAGADRIVQAVRRHKTIVTTGTTGRLEPRLAAACRQVRAGAVGRLLTVRTMHQHGNIAAFKPGHWYYNPAHGGPELSLGWYVVDLLRWVVGARVRRVYAEYENFVSPESPFMDNGKLLLRFDNGVIASADIHFSVRWQYPNWELELMGDAGTIHVRQSFDEGMLFTGAGASSIYRSTTNPLNDEVAQWIAACRKGAEPALTVEDARETLRVCLAAAESARTHQPVTLD